MSLEEIEREAMKPSPEDRVRLGETLMGSVDPDFEYEAEWASEIDRRVEEMQSGTIEMISGEQVLRNALKRLA